MKLKLTLTFDMPDKYGEWTDKELLDFLSFDYAGYITSKRLEDASHYLAKKVLEKDKIKKEIYNSLYNDAKELSQIFKHTSLHIERFNQCPTME